MLLLLLDMPSVLTYTQAREIQKPDISVKMENLNIIPTVIAVSTTTKTNSIKNTTLPKMDSLEIMIHKLSIEYEQDETLVRKIIVCESSMYESAKHVNSNGTTDYGPMQINSIHKNAMKNLGLDIYKWQDSLRYGFILLSEQGVSPWNASKFCWSH